MSTRWIITAGHCFMAYLRKGAKLMGQAEKHIEVYSINVGRYQRDGSEKFIQVLELEFFRSHPEYDFQSLKHDIAVAKLKKSAMYSAHVQPACMPQRTDVLMPESTAWVTGWGETYRVGQSARDKLKELRLPLISSTDCRASWPKHFHEAWICTVGAFNEDACAGDSGGPLVQQGMDGRWKLIGVAIAGTRRCSTDSSDIKPGIYTKVAYYRDFIDFVTQGDCAFLIILFSFFILMKLLFIYILRI
uniref:Peptidase S1 domain-containing protein n=1 Tax=Ciona savignyi TaxID=51511 RepID=H2YGC7_CIOSA